MCVSHARKRVLANVTWDECLKMLTMNPPCVPWEIGEGVVLMQLDALARG